MSWKEALKKDLDAKAFISGTVQSEIQKQAGKSRGKRAAGEMSGSTSFSSLVCVSEGVRE